ncbi:MAG: acyl-ACP--UDP-N-acetylglucosamine O-acyltransferase, partial [Muribaculaceae bacterium]|nr:acyl-ACP--UDP-N-acetylglucosamine O-acyltransferase [Muribaculaceae bacterium]
MISPLAHVDPDARIGNDVTIHPFAFISKNTEIGDGSTIYPYASILNGARIGARTKIYNGAIIAAEPQDFRWNGEPSFCYIGDDTIVREHTIINRGINPDGATRVGNKVFVMAESHIMHDAVVDDTCVIGNGAQ